jgi:hypothetical protein
MFRVMAFPLDFHSVSGDRKPRGHAAGGMVKSMARSEAASIPRKFLGF